MKTKKVLFFIQGYYMENGVPPSAQEISEHCGFKSVRSATIYCQQLLEQGYLKQNYGKWACYIPTGFRVVKEVEKKPSRNIRVWKDVSYEDMLMKGMEQ